MKKFICHSNDIDAIMSALEAAGAFDEEEGAEDEIEDTEEE